MLQQDNLKAARDAVIEVLGTEHVPSAAILGSGWTDALNDAGTIQKTISYQEIPGLGGTGVSGHAGELHLIDVGANQALIFSGRRHYYEVEAWTPVAIPIYIAQALGITKILLTNAAGSIDAELPPGSIMLIEDHINLMGSNPLLGAHLAEFGDRFPDMSCIYNPGHTELLQRELTSIGVTCKRGTYLAVSGPAYETPAEIKMFKRLGATAVGMSTVPEALLANGAGIEVAGLSCITNLASGLSPSQLSHAEVKETAATVIPKLGGVLKAFLTFSQ